MTNLLLTLPSLVSPDTASLTAWLRTSTGLGIRMESHMLNLYRVAPTLRGLAVAAGVLTALPAMAQAGLSAITHSELSLREPHGLRKAAEAGFRNLVQELGNDLAPGQLPDGFPFDVADFSELHKATLGYAFEVHSAHPQRILAGGMDFHHMLAGTGIWNFIVMSNHHPVALLEIEKVNGKWEVLGAGSAKLAQDVHLAAQTHAGHGGFRFVRIYQATSELMEVQDAQAQTRYVPLVSARESLHMLTPGKDSTLPEGGDVLPTLQNAVRRHLASHSNQ